MHFRSYTDLINALVVWQERLPRDITLVCGIPRSGTMVANLLALQWNLPFTVVEDLASGRIIGGGRRLKAADSKFFLQTPQKILVVDDSANTGRSIIQAKQALAKLSTDHQIMYAAVYTTADSKKIVDYWAENVPMPRLFEWNFLHHPDLRHVCMDIDGILCCDPTNEENDDGLEYQKFLRNASLRYLPTVEVGWLVTSRLEKYRSETEAWLNRHGVKYRELRMLDLPDMASRRKMKAGISFKALQYRETNASLFIESDTQQAISIANQALNRVLATDTMQLISPIGISGKLVVRQRDLLSYTKRQTSRLKRKASYFVHKYFQWTRSNI